MSAACERVEQHDPAQQGSNQPCGLLLSARETPTTGITKDPQLSWGSFLILLKFSGNLSLAALGIMAVMLPLFFLAMYEKDGQPLEVVAKHFYEAKFKRPKTRPYKTKNYCALLVQQADVEMEVNRIVQNGKKQERQSGAGISIAAEMTRQRSFL